jgi:tellurite resistance protein TerC
VEETSGIHRTASVPEVDVMHVPGWVWLSTIAGVLLLLIGDLLITDRRPAAVRRAGHGRRLLCYVACAALFALGLWVFAGPQPAAQFVSGYLTEYSLSADNLFVFIVIITRFAVPAACEYRALLFGQVLALVARTALIILGAGVVTSFGAVFYLFGAFLIYTAVTTARAGHDDEPSGDHGALMVRIVRKVIPVSEHYQGSRLFAKLDGRNHVTPLLVVLIAIGSTDVVFALDSIPAIFGITSNTFLIFTANAFALMGLRQLYFLISDTLRKLVYLPYGLALLLGFIGCKLILEALRSNTLPFVNHGSPIPVPIPGTLASLAFIATVLVTTIVASLIRSKSSLSGNGSRRDQP